VATAESECLHFLTTETGRSLTPDLIESLYGQFRGVIAGLVDDLAQAEEPAAPEVVGSEWQPCVKLPITVHVREQRPGEQHVSTREGITPVRPDDLIMRGVAGEEYPIGRELFQRTYRMGSADEPAVPDGGEPDSDTGRPSDEEVLRLAQQYSVAYLLDDGSACTPFQDGYDLRGELIAFASALLARWGSPAPAPQADVSQLSDGYHTFAELYEHRHSLMLALMRAQPHICWFSRRHADGELPFGSGDWFIVGAELPGAPITYHLPVTLYSLAQKTGATELPTGRPWDGHTAADVVQRLRSWAIEPAPPADERVAELVVWLLDTAIEAADASLPTAAGMLTWAAQVVGEHAELLQRGQAK